MLKPGDVQQRLECLLPCGRVAVRKQCKVRIFLVRQIIHFMLLCSPMLCKAGPLPEWKHADKEFYLDLVGSVGSCSRLLEFAENPIAYSWAGVVEVVPAVAPEVEPKARPQAQQEANEIKSDDVARYGLGDVLRDHGMWLLLYFLMGFLCVAGGYSRR